MNSENIDDNPYLNQSPPRPRVKPEFKLPAAPKINLPKIQVPSHIKDYFNKLEDRAADGD